MRSRAPFKLRGLLFFWNFGLALFSIVGITRFLPEFVHVWKNFGLHWTICESSFLDKPNKVTGFWSFAFIFSKPAELLDTLFIVLAKKPLIFLHYYHHTSVLIFSWYCLSKAYSPGRW